MGSREGGRGSSWAAAAVSERHHSGSTASAAVQLGVELRLLLCCSDGFQVREREWGWWSGEVGRPGVAYIGRSDEGARGW